MMSELPCVWWIAMFVSVAFAGALMLVIWLLDRRR